MHSAKVLSAALREAGLNGLAEKVETDFLSPLDMPRQQLGHVLKTYAEAPNWAWREEARALLHRHINGEFDAIKEERDAGAASRKGHATNCSPSASDPKAQISQLAFREEGEFLRVYFTSHGTMEGAVVIASIRITAVLDPAHKATFMALMRDLVSDTIEANTGQRSVWQEPGGERGTRAQAEGPAVMLDRADHLAQCKIRALKYLGDGDIRGAVTSMLLDLIKHDETKALYTHHAAREGMRVCMGGHFRSARTFIDGFH